MSKQSIPYAVMSKRVDDKEELDFYPTPPWATRALCEWLKKEQWLAPYDHCWEPACGAGHMSRPLGEYFWLVHSTDLESYGYGTGGVDFLEREDPSGSHPKRSSWIVTNPPFTRAQEFAVRGLEVASKGVALLVRTSFLEGVTRHRELFTIHPPAAILQFTERVPMHKGRLDPKGSTATAYCWAIWRTQRLPGHTRLDWISPCRKRLEREEDYQ
jgi:hypothetical protein